MNGGELVAQSLKQHGVEFVFGLPDTTNLGVLDAINRDNAIRYITVRHEQVASMMADAYARMTGEPGVCISQCGPGAMNLLYGVASAFKDSTPLVAITGNIESKYLGRDAWHDIDLKAIYAPVTKWSTQLTDARDLPGAMEEAFRLAKSGRPGPVHVNIPIDIQLTEIDAGGYDFTTPIVRTEASAAAISDIDRAVKVLAEAERPVIFAGGGVLWAKACDSLLKFSERTGIPVILSDNARGAIPESHPNALGASGFFGSPIASKALREADALFGVGTRFPDVATGKGQDFNPNATVIQNNLDPREIGRQVRVSIGLVTDAKQCLDVMLERWDALNLQARGNRVSRNATLKKEIAAELAFALATPPGNHERIPIQDMTREISTVLGDDVIVVMDGGLFQICAARLSFNRPYSFLSSAGLGAMGYGLAGGMGAKLARPDSPVVVISGDGGFQMVSQELETAVRADIPLVVIIYNNNTFAAPRAHQQRTYNGRFFGVDHTNPDFAALARLYGAEGRTVKKIADLRPALESLLKSGRVGVIEVQGV